MHSFINSTCEEVHIGGRFSSVTVDNCVKGVVKIPFAELATL